MVHSPLHRNREIVVPTIHRGAGQPLVAQDEKWDKDGALVEPVWNRNITTHKTSVTKYYVYLCYIILNFGR